MYSTPTPVETSVPAAAARPELLAPAGDWDCLKAAIENGADAIYFGLDCGFNARARAHNFHAEELPEIARTLHRRGVKGYVTLNTLAFPSELPAVAELIQQIAAAGIDAILVQDIGVLRLARAICPELAVHASTQMTLTSSECIALAEELGCERVVLARELSLDEITQIHSQTAMPIETFVHGALCVAYSGQCLTSESLGGRSANRGQCAQACRLPYDLIVDGVDRDLGEQKYLLSPQDLAAFDLVPQLIAAGVCSFKIEGRLKSPEYVANITRHYRKAIDEAWQGRAAQFSRQDVEEMELSFSRGFSHGWLEGCDHKMLVPAISSSKRGVLLGSILAVNHGRVRLKLESTIKRGDGLAFDSGKAEDNEQGGRVYDVIVQGRSAEAGAIGNIVELTFGHDSLDWEQIWPGQRVFKTDDPELTRRLRKSYTGEKPVRRQPLVIAAEAEVGQPLRLVVRLPNGREVRLQSEEPLAEANKHALSAETLADQLGRLGGTPWELERVEANIIGKPMAPFSVLGKLRHAMIEALEAFSQALPPRSINFNALEQLRVESTFSASAADGTRSLPATLFVLTRSLPQLAEVLAAGIRDVYADFADIREYRQAVEHVHAVGGRIWLATPRIQKPDEMGIFKLIAKKGADGVLVRNLAGLSYFPQQGLPVVCDFSLNAANELTADWLWSRGPQRITPSYDLNREQLLELVDAVPPQWLEVVLHQHMPLFHMEHCVFCSVMSPGTNKTNCGRPCDVHRVELRDRIGVEHPLKADVGCRNTLFNAVPQSGAELVPQLLTRGVRSFRIELLEETGSELTQVLDLYQQLLAGKVTGKDVWSLLRATNRVGVTRGTLEERKNPLSIM